MRALILFVALLVLFPCAVWAQPVPLQVELADSRVDITTGFNGTKVVLFGTSDEAVADIVIILRGPETTVAVRRKGRVMGAWMNRKSVEFRRVPSYYDIASTLSDEYLESNQPALIENQIGLNHLDIYTEDNEDAATLDIFRDALIRNMQEQGLYALKPHVLNSLNPRFFKATFLLPPGVPTGLYTIETLMLRDNAVLSKESRTLMVGQVGFNARVYLFSREYSFFYGIFAVVMALITGWSAFTFLRRD